MFFDDFLKKISKNKKSKFKIDQFDTRNTTELSKLTQKIQKYAKNTTGHYLIVFPRKHETEHGTKIRENQWENQWKKTREN